MVKALWNEVLQAQSSLFSACYQQAYTWEPNKKKSEDARGSDLHLTKPEVS